MRTPDEAELSVATPANSSLSSSYKNYALFLLMSVYALNVLDRQIFSILMEPIKHELHLSDTQLGLLNGLAFAIFYVLMGIPIAALADRTNRRNIIAIAVAIFSCMTFVSGMVTNFVQLLLARIFLAIGEAGTSPAGHSMISDMFPREKRAAALSMVTVGSNVGMLSGFLLGGWISQLYGWRAAFFVVGIPGILLAVLIRLTMREPARGGAEEEAAKEQYRASPLQVAKFLWSQKAFRHLIAGVTVMSISNFAVVTWVPAFLMRVHNFSSSEAGTVLAIFFGIVAGVGTILSGYIADRLSKRDMRWNVWIVAISLIFCFPFYVAFFLADTKWVVMALFTVPALVFSFYFSPTIAMTHALVPVHMRAQSSAIYLFIMSLLGSSIGPQVVGIISDLLQPAYGKDSLRYALLVMPPALIWGGLHFILSARSLREDIARVKN